MAAQSLEPGVQVVAFRIQEAMMHGDVRSRLDSAVRDHMQDAGSYGYYVDHSGDGESGDVIYSNGSKTFRAPYEIGTLGGKSTTNINHDEAEEVAPSVSYDCIADDDDNYAAMEEAGLYTKGPLPLCERFISKDERAKHGDEDFAGKGKSFPIFEPGDISAAVKSIGRAGEKNVGSSTIKSRIVAIAKRKGWTKYLPKTWQGTDSSEAAASPVAGDMKLVESVAFVADIQLREAYATGNKIKLIAPGPGASAWYTEAALKQAAADKIFHAGLPMRIDHPTEAEEAARPEGSVKDWGAVLASDAEWLESYIGKDGKDSGKGLYSEIKPFSDHARTIQEKGPYAGVSIRANGNVVVEAGKRLIRDGVPVLAKFTSAEGADMVTRAGAGGMFLSESARLAAINPQEVEMTEAEVKTLVESAVAAAVAAVQSPVKALEARALRGDAMVEANRIMSGMTLIEAAKMRVIDAVLREGAVPMKDGVLDTVKFTEIVNAEAKREGAYLASVLGTGVRGLGATGIHAVEADPEKASRAEEATRKADERFRESETKVFAELMGNQDAAAHAVRKGAA